MTCNSCGATRSKKFYGMRKGEPVCLKCYVSERKKRVRKKKRNHVYSMWGE